MVKNEYGYHSAFEGCKAEDESDEVCHQRTSERPFSLALDAILKLLGKEYLENME